jgi:hypothetical protein
LAGLAVWKPLDARPKRGADPLEDSLGIPHRHAANEVASSCWLAVAAASLRFHAQLLSERPPLGLFLPDVRAVLSGVPAPSVAIPSDSKRFLDIRSLEVLADLAIEPRDHLGGLCRSAEEVFYILDVVRGRFPFEALKRKVMEVKQRYGSATLLIEDSVPTTKPKRLAATANRLILAPDGRSLQVIWRALIGLFRSRAALEAENSRAGGLALSAQSAFHAA